MSLDFAYELVEQGFVQGKDVLSKGSPFFESNALVARASS